MTLPDLATVGPHSVLHCEHLELARLMREGGAMADAVLVDAPYSDRVHMGHDESARGHLGAGQDASIRRSIAYTPWTPADVDAFAATWAPLTRGWIVSITDHVLAPAWQDALEAAGRYAFAPLPLFEPGSRVRLSGDGPSSWTCWIVVARPRTPEFVRWGTLPGGYALAPGPKRLIVGGKSIEAMRALVRDYSRPGDLVVDPCAGGGTTLVAAKLEGRRALGCDRDAAHVEIARERLRETPTAAKAGTLALFGAA